MNKEKNGLHVHFALLDFKHSQSPPLFTIPDKISAGHGIEKAV